MRKILLIAVLGLTQLSACKPNCDEFVGVWQGEAFGSSLQLTLRTDQSLTTLASSEVTGGRWQCTNSNEVLLLDRSLPPAKALIQGGALVLPADAKLGRPEIRLNPK
jgi:hypothetical protein